VVPLLGWRPAADDEYRPKGPPLLELFDTIDRLVWSRPGVAKKSRSNRMRTKELARSLPSHPTPSDIAAWMCALDGIMEPGTVDQHRRSLSAVYSYASDLTISQGNPAKRATPRKHRPDPRPILNINELWPTLLEVCQDERERAFLGVMRFAGLRRGEALGLMRQDVNTRDPWRLTVVRQRPYPNDLHHTKPKSESGCRELPVRDPLRELLAPVLDLPNPQVWTGHGGRVVERVPYLFPYREHELRNFGDRLREVAPLAFPRGRKMWHALRDSLVMEMRAAGKTWSECGEVSGHSSEYVTRCSYGGVLGRPVHANTLAGLDPPTSGPPVKVTSGPKKRTPPAQTGGVQRRSKAGSPPVTKESKRCDTPSRSVKKVQPRLPGMQVQPVVQKPKRGQPCPF
jgi:integrase